MNGPLKILKRWNWLRGGKMNFESNHNLKMKKLLLGTSSSVNDLVQLIRGVLSKFTGSWAQMRFVRASSALRAENVQPRLKRSIPNSTWASSMGGFPPTLYRSKHTKKPQLQ